MNQQKEFLKSSLVAFIVRILGALSGFLMNLIIARNLSVEQSGLFFLGYAVCTFFSTVCMLGLPNALIRFIGSYSTENNLSVVKGVFNKGVRTSFFFTLLFTILLYSFSGEISNQVFGKESFKSTLQLFLLALPFYVVIQLLGFSFQGLGKSVLTIICQNIAIQFIVILCILLACLLSPNLSAENITVFFLCSCVMVCGIAFYKWLRTFNNAIKPDYSETKNLIESAKPLWVMMLVSALVEWSGQIVTGIYVSSEQVAFFSVAQRVAMLTSFVLIAVNLVAAPRFAAISKKGDHSELRSLSLLCSRLMIFLATPVLLFMLFFPEFILGFFGEDYKQASNILRILVLGQFVNVITGSVGYLLNMSGHEREMRNVVLFSGPLALILAFVLTPLYGTLGAAIATAVALACQNLIAVYIVKKRLGFNTLNIIG
ncbi:oligosaccharide flippase family protein [Thalassotalea aquiviva]|uniref:oligosaccharide flippase family protein n=1 Tax=Thalassotalea aquiviva TaxID=3242415 RepID=UPI00352A3B68